MFTVDTTKALQKAPTKASQGVRKVLESDTRDKWAVLDSNQRPWD
jgi:hypothetical protein